ncbi:glycerophosphodiester phosphodiesterase family protein [Bacillus thermotolerans]|uniref:glycerophosphodiester phosphodiesterase family protein n=1 Tax=Bacillus thermotolerans TaxID=1221996 RepID=UPI0005891AF5|nr:glycerophosphodiester phosphodiesterase family protein [Bacillus thermotolerans]KKB44779.1 Glycerophosphoryl diester phosphodiesterase [Bacillus thermotolerans]
MKLRKACLLSFAAAAIASGGITEQTSAAPAPAASSVHQQSPSFKQIHSMLLDHRKNAPLMITAHRGQWRDYPENSLMAIDEAIRDGAEIVEIDVRLTADGVPVLMHDTTVDRTTNGTGKVSDYTLAEIKKLRLKEGLGGEGAALTDHSIPTLEEAMRVVKGRAIVNLDKGWSIREEMYDVLVKTGTVDHALFKGSPNVEEAAAFMAKDPEILYMHIINDATADVVDTFPGRQPVAYEVVFDQLSDPQIQPDKIEQIQKNSRVFINTMWYGLASTYTDESSLRDVELGWEAVTDLRATILQTDNLEAMDYWRDGGHMKFWEAQKGNRTVRVQAEDYLPGKDWVDVGDTDGAIVVEDHQEGEWAKYEVTIPKSGVYTISGRVSANASPAGTVRIDYSNGQSSGDIEVKNTTHIRAFELQEWDQQYLEKGKHTFTVHVTSPGQYQLDYLQFDWQK